MLGLMMSYAYPLEDSQILLMDGTSSLLMAALATRSGANTSICLLSETKKMPGKNRMRCFRQMNVSIDEYHRFDYKSHNEVLKELEEGKNEQSFTQ